MTWLLRTVLMAVAGLAVGAVASLGLATPPPNPLPDPSAAPVPDDIERRPLPQLHRRILLVWTPRSLPPDVVAAVAALPRTQRTTVVKGDRVDLVRSTDASGKVVDRPRLGWAIPLDALAIDVDSYSSFLPPSGRAVVRRLTPGRVVLGETSARLRRLAPGDWLRLRHGPPLQVAGVVDDTFVGAAEVVLNDKDAARAGVRTDRFMLVEYSGRRAGMEAAVRRVLPLRANARIRGPGETPYLRHGDAVLPQALVKSAFGEFAYRRPVDGAAFAQDPHWIREHIVTVGVPILGQVTCHRGLIRPLRGALRDLRDAGLAHLVDPADFAGCWNPRLVSRSGGVSRHAWGIGVDFNAAANPTGSASAMDDRLVSVMERWGFTWGGFWLVPDPMHFEYAEAGGS